MTLGTSLMAALLISPHLQERSGQWLLRGGNIKPVFADKQAARPEQSMTVLSVDVFALFGIWFWWELGRGKQIWETVAKH